MSNLVMKVVGPDMKSYGGFLWPESGYVEAPDWDPTPVCGGGLHGWLNGIGNLSCQSFSDQENAKWLVLEVENFVHLVGKVKFRAALVVHCGTMQSAAQYLLQNGVIGPVIGSTVSGGNYSMVSGGDYSMVSGGHYSTVSGGDNSTVSGGGKSTVSGGYGSTVSGGYGSILIVRDELEAPHVAIVGINGILPDTPYSLVNGEFKNV